MWPLWESYFSKCPNGSYTVTVHYQEHFGTRTTDLHRRIRKFVDSVGGRLVCECAGIILFLAFTLTLMLAFSASWVPNASRYARMPE